MDDNFMKFNIDELLKKSICAYEKNEQNFNMFSQDRVGAKDLINNILKSLNDSQVILECGAGNGVFGGILAYVFKSKRIISTDIEYYDDIKNKEEYTKVNYTYSQIAGIDAVKKYNAIVDTLIIMHYNPHHDEDWITDTFNDFMKNIISKKVIFIYTLYDIGDDLESILKRTDEFDITTEIISLKECKYCNISIISKKSMKQNGGYYKKYIKYKNKYLNLLQHLYYIS